MSGNRKPGILFLEALPTIAGGQTVLLNLVPALRERYRLSALLPGEGPLAEALWAEGVESFFAPIGRYSLMRKSLRDVVSYAARTPLLVWQTVQLIHKWGADLVYANSGPPIIWGTIAAQLANCPIVWHHHNLLSDGKTLAIVRLAARLSSVRSIICASSSAQLQLAAQHNKTIVIPNGVDVERFKPDPAARDRVRRELGIAEASFTVGMIGDLIPLKHQDTLLAALPMLSAKVPDAWAIFVGGVRPHEVESQQYLEYLHQMHADRAIFLGERRDIPAVLNAFDVLVVASERETGPLVLLEAIATGIPVLSTAVGRAPELLTPDALFPVGDAHALAAKLANHLHSGVQQSVVRNHDRKKLLESISQTATIFSILQVIDDALSYR